MDGILRRGADAFSVQGTGHGAAAAGPPLAQTANALELGAVPAARGQELLEEPFELRLLAPGERLQKLGQGDAAGNEQIVEHRLPLGGEVEGETAPPAGAGGAVLAAFLSAAGRLKATPRELIGAGAIGTVILGDIGVLAVAEQEVPAGLATLIIASVPLWIVLLQLGAREPVASRTVVAVLAGIAGVGLLVDPGGEAPVGWLLVLVAAAAVEAAGQFFSRSTPLPDDPLANSTVQLVAAGLALGIAGLALGEAGALDAEAFSADSLLAFAYLVVPGSIVAYTAFTWLLRNAPITTVSTYAYVNPVVAVATGWALLDERITTEMAVGGAVIVGSVALVIRGRR